MSSPSSRRLRRFACSAVLVALAVAAAPSAHADPGDMVTANALYDEGRRLLAAEQIAEACDKFEASLAIATRLGVQLNLATCYERLGRTASAWRVFGDAAAIARRLGDPREDFARRRVAALVPRLSRLAISVPAATRHDLTVTRDGVQIPAAAYDVGVPVDPGEHLVEATQPGRLSWSARVTVVAEGDVRRVVVPELAPVPSLDSIVPPIPAGPDPDTSAAPPPPGTSVSSPRAPGASPPDAPLSVASGPRPPPRAAWIAAGVGVSGAGLGTYFGLSARAAWDRARPGCDSRQRCSDDAYADALRSRRAGRLANGAFVVSGAALVTGLVFYLMAPAQPDGRLQIRPSGAADHAGVTMSGAF